MQKIKATCQGKESSILVNLPDIFDTPNHIHDVHVSIINGHKYNLSVHEQNISCIYKNYLLHKKSMSYSIYNVEKQAQIKIC